MTLFIFTDNNSNEVTMHDMIFVELYWLYWLVQTFLENNLIHIPIWYIILTIYFQYFILIYMLPLQKQGQPEMRYV